MQDYVICLSTNWDTCTEKGLGCRSLCLCPVDMPIHLRVGPVGEGQAHAPAVSCTVPQRGNVAYLGVQTRFLEERGAGQVYNKSCAVSKTILQTWWLSLGDIKQLPEVTLSQWARIWILGEEWLRLWSVRLSSFVWHREDIKEDTELSWRLTCSRCTVSVGQEIGIKTKVLSFLGPSHLCTWGNNSTDGETQHLLWAYCLRLLPQFSSSLNREYQE